MEFSILKRGMHSFSQFYWGPTLMGDTIYIVFIYCIYLTLFINVTGFKLSEKINDVTV